LLGSEFRTLLESRRAELERSLSTFSIQTIPEANAQLDIGQTEIWNRIAWRVNDTQEIFAAHCEKCKEEFEHNITGAIAVLDKYATGGLTNPKQIWNVSYMSTDGQHGYSKVLTTENIPEVEGYEISNVSTAVAFKEEF